MVARDELLEWAVVHGRHRYGTPARPGRAGAGRRPAGAARDRPAGRPAGARADAGGAVRLPGAARRWEELVRRLVGRGTETEEEREPPAGHRPGGAGGRARVRRDHRQRRRTAGQRGIRILDAGPESTSPPTAATRDDTPDQRDETDACPEPGRPRGITNPPIDDLLTRPTPSTPWSSTPPSAPARSTPTTPSSARACWSTSARSSTPTCTRSRCPSRCARSTRAC